MRGNAFLGGVSLIGAILHGCAEDEAIRRVPWDPDQASVISNGQVTVFGTASPGDCVAPLDAPVDYCENIQASVERCDSGETTTEVVVDDDGRVLDVVCIPPELETVTAIDLYDGEIDQTSNNTALIFEEDGIYAGDLVVDGNRVVVYGASPADATLDGTLTLEGNNSIVRGVTITGDLNVAKNNPVVVYCVVLGDVYLAANNSRISGCDIWGDVVVTGNNTELHGNRIRGAVTVGGNGTVCSGNREFDDADSDGAITPDEIGGQVTCK